MAQKGTIRNRLEPTAKRRHRFALTFHLLVASREVVEDVGQIGRLEVYHLLVLLARVLVPQKIPAVALSGSGMPQDVRDSMDAGFMDHLVKPVRFEQLEAVLRKIAAARSEPRSETVGCQS